MSNKRKPLAQLNRANEAVEPKSKPKAKPKTSVLARLQAEIAAKLDRPPSSAPRSPSTSQPQARASTIRTNAPRAPPTHSSAHRRSPISHGSVYRSRSGPSRDKAEALPAGGSRATPLAESESGSELTYAEVASDAEVIVPTFKELKKEEKASGRRSGARDGSSRDVKPLASARARTRTTRSAQPQTSPPASAARPLRVPAKRQAAKSAQELPSNFRTPREPHPLLPTSTSPHPSITSSKPSGSATQLSHKARAHLPPPPERAEEQVLVFDPQSLLEGFMRVEVGGERERRRDDDEDVPYISGEEDYLAMGEEAGLGDVGEEERELSVASEDDGGERERNDGAKGRGRDEEIVDVLDSDGMFEPILPRPSRAKNKIKNETNGKRREDSTGRASADYELPLASSTTKRATTRKRKALPANVLMDLSSDEMPPHLADSKRAKKGQRSKRAKKGQRRVSNGGLPARRASTAARGKKKKAKGSPSASMSTVSWTSSDRLSSPAPSHCSSNPSPEKPTAPKFKRVSNAKESRGAPRGRKGRGRDKEKDEPSAEELKERERRKKEWDDLSDYKLETIYTL